MRRSVMTLLAVLATGAAAASAAAGPPPPGGPGDPGCLGTDTANFAQDWKSFSFEPAGVAPLAEFYGATNPTDWLLNDRLTGCSP